MTEPCRTELVKEVLSVLGEHLGKYLTRPTLLPLHEVSTFKSLAAVQDNLLAAPSIEHSGLIEVM